MYQFDIVIDLLDGVVVVVSEVGGDVNQLWCVLIDQGCIIVVQLIYYQQFEFGLVVYQLVQIEQVLVDYVFVGGVFVFQDDRVVVFVQFK